MEFETPISANTYYSDANFLGEVRLGAAVSALEIWAPDTRPLDIRASDAGTRHLGVKDRFRVYSSSFHLETSYHVVQAFHESQASFFEHGFIRDRSLGATNLT